MKTISMLVRFAGLLALGATAPFAFGLSTNDAYVASYRGRTDIPVPVKVVAPTVDASLVGNRVELEFLVDTRGRPQNIRLQSATDSQLGESVNEAVSRWKFAPAKSNGAAVAMKVLLPVVISGPE